VTINYNFTQIDSYTWKVTQRTNGTLGGSFNFFSNNFNSAKESFLRTMWGSKFRPDGMDFDDWKKTVTYRFLTE